MKRDHPNNVLVTCGGKWVGHVLQLRQAMEEVPEFRGGRIFVADREPITPAGAFADGSFVVPQVSDPQYPNALVEICRHHQLRVIVPLIDIDVVYLAPHRERFFDAGVFLVAPPPHVAELCFDKRLFNAWAKKHGIPVPRTFFPEELEDAPYPLFAKPVRGFGSIGARVCRDIYDARRVLEEPGIFLEEFCCGQEFSVDGYVNADGHAVVRVVRIRQKVVGGEAYRSRTVQAPDVAAVADQVLNSLAAEGHRGPVNIQLIQGERITVIDVNPRLGSAVLLSNQATGGRLFRHMLEEAVGRTATGDPNDYLVDLQLWRFLGELFYFCGEIHGVYPPPGDSDEVVADMTGGRALHREDAHQSSGMSAVPEPHFLHLRRGASLNMDSSDSESRSPSQ